MFDIKWIRDNSEAFDKALAKRGYDASSAKLISLDDARRAHITKLQEAQERRNAASKEIGKAKASGDNESAQKLIDEVAEIKSFIQNGEEEERKLVAALEEAMAGIPNVPHEDVPEGEDENDNVFFRGFGEKPTFSFNTAPKEHYELGEDLGGMDFATAAKLSGSRFVVLKGQIARLERALGQFMIDLHTAEHGYTEVSPPLLVNETPLFGTGQLPKFEEDQFKTTTGHYMIPTAEVPLTNLIAGEILGEDELPLRVAALTYCFRSEAGSAGRDTRGMLRQHQFEKCELVSVTTPDKSLEELERMLDCAETVLKKLGIHYRVMTLCAGDMGFGARKTYDIEAWLPGQDTYREISSCSVCGDFQARRMNARYRPEGSKQLSHVHTLNGSGVAVGRALIAVVENYQNGDGSITVPDVLRPYMNGLETIG
ncbi:seryl-tRNA synthetase [Roseibium hamelinense]|uniref:Serine--tRNA ligase n=1 Tax=Roseibium hamelinense TaxID=150831 RepID=A0A562THU3_9HYPH|nr:serine--tRNA ligase [Roseibium hamelinense]MTI45675.1 serine--tRNA ligase [Roseibium hamelinense]TWI93142.1 seryl-tRNA synthetase [Roseibium hamelinense]